MADENSTQGGGECSQPRKPSVPWAAFKAAWPEGLQSCETPPRVLHPVLCPQHKIDMELWEQVQTRARKLMSTGVTSL